MIASPGSLLWFAGHEARLRWRDGQGRKRSLRRRLAFFVGAVLFIAALHAIGYAVLESYTVDPQADRLLMGGFGVVFAALMISQTLEAVTRSFYARGDLDLILSSPTSYRALFAVRIGVIALTQFCIAAALSGPFINMMAWFHGARFLSVYGVLFATAMLAAAIGTLVTTAMIASIGPRPARLVAQIVAAIVGAGFVIGIQAVAILSEGKLSRLAAFRSDAWSRHAPDPASPFWWPTRAASGEPALLVALIVGALLVLMLTTYVTAQGYAARSAEIAGAAGDASPRQGRASAFRSGSQAQALRRKEWLLLKRDPWLVSQSLMQLLYLLPPALLLWQKFGEGANALIFLVPVLVMAAGQLGGGLAWLAISGEDAPELMATAPVTARQVLRAKTEAVLLATGAPLLPFVLGLALVSPWIALTTAIFAGLAVGGSTIIQLAFRAQAKRSNFRRRQNSSTIATFAEVTLATMLAAGAGLAAAEDWRALAPVAIAALALFLATVFAPERSA